MQLNTVPVILSPNRTIVGTPPRQLDVVVLHDMEWTETDTTAEACAKYFSQKFPAGQGKSAHYCVDNNSVVQCVPIKDVAWAAPGNNTNGIQIEFAGYARQTAAEWADTYSAAALKRGAELVAALCKAYVIPITFLTAAALLRGERGITTHAEVSKAWKKSTHSDPGVGFPLAAFVASVLAERAKLDPPKPKVVTFELVVGGKVVAESTPVEGVGTIAERVRLGIFLHNQLRRIHAQLALPGGLPVTLKRKAV